MNGWMERGKKGKRGKSRYTKYTKYKERLVLKRCSNHHVLIQNQEWLSLTNISYTII